MGSPNLRLLQRTLHLRSALHCLEPLHCLRAEVPHRSRQCCQLAHSQRSGGKMGGLRGKIDLGCHNLRRNFPRYRHLHTELRLDYVRVGLGMGVLSARLAAHDLGGVIRHILC